MNYFQFNCIQINHVRINRAQPAKRSVKISEISMSYKNSRKKIKKHIYIISINYNHVFPILYWICLIWFFGVVVKILSDYQQVVSSNLTKVFYDFECFCYII